MGSPCLFTDILLLGVKDIVIEKQDAFSHNNTANLWPLPFMTCKVWRPRSSRPSSESGSWSTPSLRQVLLRNY